ACFTKPDPDDLLRNFYERAKPLGCWGVYARRATRARKSAEAGPIIKGMVLAVIGFAATCLLVIGLTDLWFANYSRGGGELLASGVLFWLFRNGITKHHDFIDNRDRNFYK